MDDKEVTALYPRLLNCGHTVHFYPPLPDHGDELWCAKCNGSARVVSKTPRNVTVGNQTVAVGS